MSLDDIEYKAHATLGPSGAKKWAYCTMAPTAEMGKPDNSHDRTRYGTAAHLVLSDCLEALINTWLPLDPIQYMGKVMLFGKDPAGKRLEWWRGEPVEPGTVIEHESEVDEEMVNAVATVIEYVIDLVNSCGGVLEVEQRLSIMHITKERNAYGTTDVAILDWKNRRIIILDAKFGFIRVFAEYLIQLDDGSIKRDPNEQLVMYAEAKLNAIDPKRLHFDTVTLIVAQPFTNPPFNEASFTRDEVQQKIDWLAGQAEKTRTSPEYQPSYDACLYCKANVDCDARNDKVFELIESDAMAKPLGERFESVAFVRDWCKTQEDAMKAALLRGESVRGRKGTYKLVEGASGDRAWTNPEAAVQALKAQGVSEEHLYRRKPISPTMAENLSKGAVKLITKQQFAQLSEFITRGAKGPPRIVVSTDPSPPLPSATDGFTDVDDGDSPPSYSDIF